MLNAAKKLIVMKTWKDPAKSLYSTKSNNNNA